MRKEVDHGLCTVLLWTLFNPKETTLPLPLAHLKNVLNGNRRRRRRRGRRKLYLLYTHHLGMTSNVLAGHPSIHWKAWELCRVQLKKPIFWFIIIIVSLSSTSMHLARCVSLPLLRILMFVCYYYVLCFFNILFPFPSNSSRRRSGRLSLIRKDAIYELARDE